MNFIITILENQPEKVLVKNISDKDFCYDRGITLCVKQNEEVMTETHVAKLLLGDWTEENTYKEQKRRLEKGINHIKLEIRTKPAQISSLVDLPEQSIKQEKIEDEFPDLKEAPICQATTKSGKPCRAFACTDSDYCMVHQKKGE